MTFASAQGSVGFKNARRGTTFAAESAGAATAEVSGWNTAGLEGQEGRVKREGEAGTTVSYSVCMYICSNVLSCAR